MLDDLGLKCAGTHTPLPTILPDKLEETAGPRPMPVDAPVTTAVEPSIVTCAPRGPGTSRSCIASSRSVVPTLPCWPMKLLLVWESLRGPVQFLVSLPVTIVLLFLLHLGPLNQPPARALFYGVFWGLLASLAITLASQNEARKRRGEPLE